MAENTDFERTALIETDGTAHYDNGAEKNVAQRRYFQEAIQGNETLSDPLESSVDKETRVILGIPVYQNGNVIAVLGGSYNVTALNRMLFNDVFDNSGYSLIVNQNGEIISSSFMNAKTYYPMLLCKMSVRTFKMELMVP